MTFGSPRAGPDHWIAYGMGQYLVTGAAGFIGSKVAESLLADGHAVVGVDDLNEAYDIRLKRWRLERIRDPGFVFRQLDICDRDALREQVFEETAFDAAINLAARAGVRPSVAEPHAYVRTNVEGALTVLECCRKFGVGKFVQASTSAVYGAAGAAPCRENQPTDRQLSPYAASKKAAEVLCRSYHCLHGMDIAILRYFTVYGPAGRPDMSPLRFVRWIAEKQPLTVYGDGSQSRDFTYIDDVARGTTLALASSGYDVFNLGSDRPVVLLDAIRTFEQLLGEKARLVFADRHKADVSGTWANISKAKALLGWAPRIDFAEGARRLAAWYAAHRDWARTIRLD